MSEDMWSRPTPEDLRKILENIGQPEHQQPRSAQRLSLSIPAELITARGNTISAMTREISRNGLGLLHRGSVMPGEVVVRLASETREYEYRLMLEWCSPCGRGMFMSGGRFLEKSSQL